VRQVDPEAGKHFGGAVQANHAMAGVHKGASDRYAIAATEIQNARTSWQPGAQRSRFRDADRATAMGQIPVSNKVLLAHVPCV
jgi:hypothetical protein